HLGDLLLDGRRGLAAERRPQDGRQFTELGCGYCGSVPGGQVSRRILLALSPPVHAALWNHLVPTNHRFEEAAFVYAARETTDDGDEVFRAVEWSPVPRDGFVTRSAVHFELADAMRAAV